VQKIFRKAGNHSSELPDDSARNRNHQKCRHNKATIATEVNTSVQKHPYLILLMKNVRDA
jgi:hypothetical protein